MFKYLNKLKAHHQTIFAFIIAFAVISFWRGAWGLLDLYLFPANYELSLWVSLKVGVGILIATHFAARELM